MVKEKKLILISLASIALISIAFYFLTRGPHVIPLVNKGIVIREFYADWCPPCVKLRPVLNEAEQLLQSKHGDNVKFEKIDFDTSIEIAELHRVYALPATIILVDGVEVKRWTGLFTTDELVDYIDSLVLESELEKQL